MSSELESLKRRERYVRREMWGLMDAGCTVITALTLAGIVSGIDYLIALGVVTGCLFAPLSLFIALNELLRVEI